MREPRNYVDDSFGLMLVGGQKELTPVQFRASVAAAAIAGEIWVAVVPTTSSVDSAQAMEEGELKGVRVVGAAVWFGPGQVLNSTCVKFCFWMIGMRGC